MIVAVHAVTSRRNTRPRAVTFLGTGEQEDDRIDKGDRHSLRQSFPCALLRCPERRQFSVQCRDGRWYTPPTPPPHPPPVPKPRWPRVLSVPTLPTPAPKVPQPSQRPPPGSSAVPQW